MAAAVTLTRIRNLLASLNGEDSAPSSTSRDRFINEIIRDVTTREQWSWRRKSTTLSFASDGTASAPADFVEDSLGDLREIATGVGNDNLYKLTGEEYRDNYNANSNYAVWVTGNNVDGFTFRTSETDSPTGTLIYYAGFVTDLADGADTTYVPNALVIAKGAYALLRRFDDPDVDITTELIEYEAEVGKLRVQYTRGVRGRPPRLISKSEREGYYIGKVD